MALNWETGSVVWMSSPKKFGKNPDEMKQKLAQTAITQINNAMKHIDDNWAKHSRTVMDMEYVLNRLQSATVFDFLVEALNRDPDRTYASIISSNDFSAAAQSIFKASGMNDDEVAILLAKGRVKWARMMEEEHSKRGSPAFLQLVYGSLTKSLEEKLPGGSVS